MGHEDTLVQNADKDLQKKIVSGYNSSLQCEEKIVSGSN